MNASSLLLLMAASACTIFSFRVEGQSGGRDQEEQFVQLVVDAYGQDQELINGRQYYNKHPLSKGNPYLFDGILQMGTVTLRGVRYDRVLLRYDIYNQKIEVDYSTLSGALNRVVLVDDRIDAFSIGPLSFRKIITDEGREMIYQLAGYGQVVFYIHWEKRLVPLHGDTEFLEEYSAARNHIAVMKGGDLVRVKNMRQLISLYPERGQKELKRLFKNLGYQIRTATPVELDVIFKEISTRLNQEAV